MRQVFCRRERDDRFERSDWPRGRGCGHWRAFDFQFRAGIFGLSLARRCVKIQQGPARRFGGVTAHRFLLMKLHLAFGRMNVHVHPGGVEFEEQTADRIASLHQRGVITFQERVVQRAVVDGPTVDEEVLVLARRPRDTRRAQETPDADL